MKVTIFEGTPDEVIEVLRNLPNSNELGKIKITTLAEEDITGDEGLDESGQPKPKPTPPTKPPQE